MNLRIRQIYKNFGGATDQTLKPVDESWSETVAELSARGVNVDNLASLIEEGIGKGESAESFGHHVLHKLTKAVSVVRVFKGAERDDCMQSVIGDLEQITDYASRTQAGERSFIGCVRGERST